MSLCINSEKLARSLENSVDPHKVSFYRGMLLGFPQCGLVGTIVKMYAQDMGFSSETILSKPKLRFNPSLEHVMTVIHDQPNNPLVVDPTWGQFLYYVGYDNAYDKMTGKQIFPDYSDQILTYRMNEHKFAARKFARAAFKFKEVELSLIEEIVPADIDGERISLGSNWLPDVTSEEQLIEAFDPIWDSSNFHSFEATGVELKLARIASASIPMGIITPRLRDGF